MKNNTIDTLEYISLGKSYIEEYGDIVQTLLESNQALLILSQLTLKYGFVTLNETKYFQYLFKNEFLKNNELDYYEMPYQDQKILRIRKKTHEIDTNNSYENKEWQFFSATYVIKNKIAEINAITFTKKANIDNCFFTTELKINPVKKSAHFVLKNKRKKHNIFLFTEDSQKYEFLDSNDELLNNMDHTLKSVVQDEVNGLVFLLSQENDDINKAIFDCCFHNKKIEISQDLKEQYQLLYDNTLSLQPILFSSKIMKKENLNIANKIKM